MGRQLRRSTLIVAVLGILVVLNILGVRYHHRWDLTAAGLFSLSDQSQTALEQLPGPVEIIAFLGSGDEQSRQVQDLLESYRYAAPDKIKLHFVDPVGEPALARQYNIQYYDTLILKSGDRERRVEPYNIFAMGASPYQVEFRGEQAVTRALLELNRQVGVTIYFLQGHGEADLNGDFAPLQNYLQGEGYTVQPLSLVTEILPEEAQLIVIGGPTRDLTAAEVDQLTAYLERGGRLLVMLDPLPPDRQLPNFDGLLDRVGVTAQPVLVVDPQRAFFMDPLSPVPNISSHAITDKLIEQNLNVVLPQARSLAAEETAAYRVQPLLVTSDAAWGEKTFPAEQVRKDTGDLPGPLNLAVAVAAPAAEPGGEGRPVAVVIGNSALGRSQAIDFQGNADLLVNSVNWLLGEQGLISIRPKEQEIRMVELTPAGVQGTFYGTVVLLPVALLAAGLVVWLRRRSR